MKRKTISLSLIFVFLFATVINLEYLPVRTYASGPDLYIKDTPADTGIEPNPNAGAMYVSEDIWVRNNPDPGYQPYPFPEGSPTWTPLAHQNPEYRDPKYSRPNFIYVRVHNRGNAASTGTEKLRVFWAKASTGLGWPAQWGGGPWTQEADYSANVCGPTKLYGQEVTKPRKNAATATAAERNAYRDAIIAIGTTHPTLDFPDASYWHKQQEVHHNTSYAKHHTPVFLPWHREYINRYEALLREQNPSVRLLYWNWTTNPETGPFNFDTSTFMGASGSGAGAANIGAPFNPPAGTTLAPPTVSRDLGGNPAQTTPISVTDTTILGRADYGGPANSHFAWSIERQAHDYAHVYIGGNTGDMQDPATAARDPFFFLLHANADRLWARWQRNTSVLSRLDNGAAYDTDAANADMTTNMGPWNGGANIRPWTAGDGYIINKIASDPSVVSPPIYDDTPLVIPVLQPGEAVVMQIPWYPPNPADYAANNCNKGHFCLLSRVETATSAPYGMTFPEVVNVDTNTRNNNNIAWKNLTVVDNFAGALKMSSIIVGNPFREPVQMGLRFVNAKDANSFFNFGRILIHLPPELLKRWRDQNREVKGGKIVRDRDGMEVIEITTPEAAIQNIKLAPGEAYPVGVEFELFKDYKAERGTDLNWDVIQTGAPRDPDAVVGGERFEVDLSKLVLVSAGSQWSYWDGGADPGAKWASTDFIDTKWKTGQAELGYGDNPATTIDGGPVNKRYITSYYRNTFDVSDPSFIHSLVMRLKRDDGAIVYLNGAEINRVNLPAGNVAASTLATREVKGVEEETFFPVKVDPKLLRQGKNVIAVEIHQNSPRTDDASFDLELTGNNVTPRFAPNLAFASLTNGSLWQRGQTIPVNIEALDGDGKVGVVSFFVDGKQVGRSDQAPFTFPLKDIPSGIHRLKAVAVDNDGQETAQELTITVMDNTPPVVNLIQPVNNSVFMTGEAIKAVAEAVDAGGKIAKVEFYLRSMDSFVADDVLVGIAAKPPYAISINPRGIKPGHYMLTAIATDNLGLSSQSSPIHISIGMMMDHH